MSSENNAAYHFIEEFLVSALTDEREQRDFLEKLNSDVEFQTLFRQNVQVDFLLKVDQESVFGKDRGRTGSFSVRLNDEKIAEYVHLMNSETEQESNLSSFCAEMLAWEKSAVPIQKEPAEELVLQPEYRKYVFFGPKIKKTSKQLDQTTRKKRSNLTFITAIVFYIALIGWLSIDHFLGDKEKEAPVESPHVIATIVDTINAVWEPGKESFKRGQRLGPCEWSLRSGVVRVKFISGAELIFEGPVNFIFKDPMSSFCQRGNVSAYIPREAIGFEIGTPFANYIDRGTEFFLSVTDKKANLNVVRGKVDLCRSKTLPTVPVVEGEVARLASNGELNKQKTNKNEFLRYISSKTFDSELTKEIKHLSIIRDERIASAVRDPRLIAFYDFQQEKIRSVPNKAHGPKALSTHAILSGGRFGEGLQFGKKSFEIRDRSGELSFDIPQPLTDMTILLAVRLDKIDRAGSLLFSPIDNSQVDPFVFQIIYSGALQLRMGSKNGVPNQYLSEPVINSSLLGTWTHLAITFDSKNKKISFYLDGKNVGDAAWSAPIPIVLGGLKMGNKKSTFLKNEMNFNGAIDHIFIFNKALTEKEIKTYHIF